MVDSGTSGGIAQQTSNVPASTVDRQRRVDVTRCRCISFSSRLVEVLDSGDRPFKNTAIGGKSEIAANVNIRWAEAPCAIANNPKKGNLSPTLLMPSYLMRLYSRKKNVPLKIK